MKKFPSEFEDLLNRKGKEILSGKFKSENFGKRGHTSVEVIKNIIDKRTAADCVKILNHSFSKSLKSVSSKIDKTEMIRMKKNYSEKLAKNLRMKTLEIGAKRSQSYELAYDCGLVQMLGSASLQHFGELVTGEKFGAVENNQIICYHSGDYVSPHTDHHPENKNVKNGYFDIHIMFSNEFVKHQLLVYEKDGFFNASYDISSPSAIAVYKLPFWHYTTPLIGKEHHEDSARRWLLLRSFECFKK